MCKTLWCHLESDTECVTKLDPAAKGTPCALGKVRRSSLSVKFCPWHLYPEGLFLHRSLGLVKADCGRLLAHLEQNDNK